MFENINLIPFPYLIHPHPLVLDLVERIVIDILGWMDGWMNRLSSFQFRFDF